ncbi:PHD finger protein 2 [Sarcoptes scabiei]|uniref:PHD finger protein 2 n=1 Tax=Sarcoptes scabiei TaxID=52283 RepID=A0A132AL33_SARSC|nr:PHD finger protein 2 [Sarcoptes scabiei]
MSESQKTTNIKNKNSGRMKNKKKKSNKQTVVEKNCSTDSDDNDSLESLPAENFLAGINSKNKDDILSAEDLEECYRKIRICSVCLGEDSQYDDEIIECDACGISVHELCYGITVEDDESVHSDASSASTEPWFCDPCKVGVTNPECDLCPNLGGIFKMSDNRRWVHMVCVLYSNDVTFIDRERLNFPKLTEICHTKFGSKICLYCPDDRFNLTGVCVCCDAGMCRTYFHVTCAQRKGFLMEFRHSEDVIDKYVAYCAKKKRQNYGTMIARNEFLMKSRKNCLKIEDSITNQRALNKLFIQREKFQKSIRSLTLDHPAVCVPRFLEASPTAMRHLISKSEMENYDFQGHYYRKQISLSFQKKWHIRPGLTTDFVIYSSDRIERIVEMENKIRDLSEKNYELNLLQKYQHQKLLKSKKDVETIRNRNNTLRSTIRRYLLVLASFNDLRHTSSLESPLPLLSSSSLPSKSASTLTIIKESEKIKRLKLGKKILSLPEMIDEDEQWYYDHPDQLDKLNKKARSQYQIKICNTCKKDTDPHLLALCDSCHLNFHLGCLDPPLKRMPKKTKFGGWQCSDCTENEENNEEAEDVLDLQKTFNENDPTIVNEDNSKQKTISSSNRRKLRENPKAVAKYTDTDNCSPQKSSPSSKSSSFEKNKKRSPEISLIEKQSKVIDSKINSEPVTTEQNSVLPQVKVTVIRKKSKKHFKPSTSINPIEAPVISKNSNGIHHELVDQVKRKRKRSINENIDDENVDKNATVIIIDDDIAEKNESSIKPDSVGSVTKQHQSPTILTIKSFTFKNPSPVKKFLPDCCVCQKNIESRNSSVNPIRE